MNVARMRDLKSRLLEERDEKANILAEKQALAARLAKLKEAGEAVGDRGLSGGLSGQGFAGHQNCCTVQNGVFLHG